MIAAGDPWRSALRRPVFGTLLLAVAFVSYTAPIKETPSLFSHASWLNRRIRHRDLLHDVLHTPDRNFLHAACTDVSTIATTPGREDLRRAQGCRVLLGGISVTLLAEWISAAIGDNRAQWNDATGLQVGLLVLMSTFALGAILDLHCVGLPRSAQQDAMSPDWLTDSFLFVKEQSRWLGPARGPVLRLLGWGEQRLLATVRRRPLLTALATSAVEGQP